MKPKRIQLSRKKGFKLPPNTAVVSRPSKWGNPYKVSDKLTQQKAVDLFRISLELSIAGSHCMDGAIDFAAANIGLLKGKNLACWCRPGTPCHADVLLEIANMEPSCSSTEEQTPYKRQVDGSTPSTTTNAPA